MSDEILKRIGTISSPNMDKEEMRVELVVGVKNLHDVTDSIKEIMKIGGKTTLVNGNMTSGVVYVENQSALVTLLEKLVEKGWTYGNWK